MKIVLVILVALVAVAVADEDPYDNTNGKPVCTANNVAIGEFRNNWDPTRYWLCSAVGEEPEVVLCPQETGYSTSLGGCVSWSEWVWEPPVNPPTA